MKISDIQKEVGEWSRFNFGNQATSKMTVSPSGLPELGKLAPLMGMAEEIGELVEAHQDDSLVEIRDALGDIAIYLCDYGCRSGVSLSKPYEIQGSYNECIEEIQIGIGRLMHANLKRCQGIRGFDDDEVFNHAEAEAVSTIVDGLHSATLNMFCESLQSVLEETWTKVVKKRNWKPSES